MWSIMIQGIECPLPELPKAIEGSKRSVKQQYYRRQEVPAFMEDIEFDSEGDPIYTTQQRSWVVRELDKCANGIWMMVKGVPRWIPGCYYYWLSYWILEDGTRPEYRECDRLFFIFLLSCFNNPYITAVIRGKARREGATSNGACFEVWLATNAAGLGGEKRIGNISKTGDDVDDLYETMVLRGYLAMPVWLRPRREGGTDPKKGLSFKVEGKKAQAKGVQDTGRKGLNSTITKRDTTLNAYDSGRWDFILIDEGGKWKKVSIIKYWRIVIDTLRKGASKVGFAYLPSTTNPPRDGGNNFRILWDQADQYKFKLSELPQGMVKFFKPAYDGLNGFIDQYGDSVIEPPDEETLAFLKEKNLLLPLKERIPEEFLYLGAKRYLEVRLSLLVDPEDISDEKRKYPVTERDMFDFGDISSPFDKDKLDAAEQYVKDNPRDCFWRQGRLVVHYYTDSGEKKIHIRFHDDNNGPWFIHKLPRIENHFHIDDYNRVWPDSSHLNGGGVDTYKFDNPKELGSKGVIMIGDMFDFSKPQGEEGGEVCAYYIGRPKLTELFHEQMLMATLFYGCTLTVEKDAQQEYIKYFKNTMPNFMDANCLPMLGKKPDIAIDKTRKNWEKDIKTVQYGTSSADAFVFSKQISLAQIYVIKYWWKLKLMILINQLQSFELDNRTPYDVAIAFMQMLLNISGDFLQRKQEARRPVKAVRTYTIGGLPDKYGFGGS